MKCNVRGALSGASKLVTVVALSTVLVACGGGTSGDSTDAGETDAGLDAGGTDAGLGLDAGDTDVDLGLDAGDTDSGGDNFVAGGGEDADGDGISDEDELDVCKGRGGTDPGSTNAEWNDNCYVEYDINPDPDAVVQGPFYNSTYATGIQRVLYCRGFGGDATSTAAFADGFFGPISAQAVRDFQTAEGLIVDGIVGPQTWGRMQTLVDATAVFISEASDADYDAFGVVPAEGSTVDCSNEVNFYGRVSADALTIEGWELASEPGSAEKGSFSIATN